MGFNPFRSVKNFFHDLKNAPEAQYITSAAAPTQFPSQDSFNLPEKVHYLETSARLSRHFTHESLEQVEQNGTAPLPPRPEKKKTNVLDVVVRAAGSRWTLGVVLLLLVLWGVLGAVFGPTDTWQVILQDVSSIQAYTSATLLMRQQNNNTRGLLQRICGLISRSESNERMVRSLTAEQRARLRASTHKIRSEVVDSLNHKQDMFDKISNGVAKATGSLIALGIYWAGIIGWVFSGLPLKFSDTWQLDVNTATALEITFTTVFLQNIRSAHDKHLDKTVQGIERLDTEIEMQLRRMTGDMTPNPTIASEPAKLNRWVKGLDIYAYIIGGSVGLVISALVFGTWILVGDPMEFDDNWFLIIGTYTGLIGFIDGFILKNVDAREAKLALKHFDKLIAQDRKIFALIGIEVPESPVVVKDSLNIRISKTVGRWVESTTASWGSILTVVALLVVASAMQWTETGQLLCNTPTMIVEGFLLLTLIQAENIADDKKRVTYEDILNRRLVLDKHLAGWGGMDDDDSVGMSFNEKEGVVVQTFRINGEDVEMGDSF
ncbi:putative low-affinity fe transport protein [Diaporthe ampelina]|uniref:Putative low-affinity fe transport protein n=1 Tax=Diaporthe ampelina TaxID=1214573 RepID=A0A0G2HQ51_9PEZI|nr:putative low-affinity fe transport protein [Diaporthe ampelina]